MVVPVRVQSGREVIDGDSEVIVMLVMLRMNVPIRNLGAGAASSVEIICTDHDQFFWGLV